MRLSHIALVAGLSLSLLLPINASAAAPSKARPSVAPSPSPRPAAPLVSAEAAVLMYHHVAVPPSSLPPNAAQYFIDPAVLDRQIYYLLAHGYHPVSLDEVVKALHGGPALPPRAVALTFDDGWQDFWKNALPIVHKYSIPVTIFAIANADRGTYMTPSERWVLDHTGVQIAAHTLSHPDLTRLLPAVAENEIAGSRKNLQKELGRPVSLFAYPYGAFDSQVENMVQAAGYEAAFAATPYSNEDSQHLMALPRVMVSRYDSLATFGQKAADYRWARTHITPLPKPRPVPSGLAPANASSGTTSTLTLPPGGGSSPPELSNPVGGPSGLDVPVPGGALLL